MSSSSTSTEDEAQEALAGLSQGIPNALFAG